MCSSLRLLHLHLDAKLQEAVRDVQRTHRAIAMVIRVATAAMMGPRSAPHRPSARSRAHGLPRTRLRVGSARNCVRRTLQGSRMSGRRDAGARRAHAARGAAGAWLAGARAACTPRAASSGWACHGARAQEVTCAACTASRPSRPVSACACAAGKRIWMRENQPTPSHASTARYVRTLRLSRGGGARPRCQHASVRPLPAPWAPPRRVAGAGAQVEPMTEAATATETLRAWQTPR